MPHTRLYFTINTSRSVEQLVVLPEKQTLPVHEYCKYWTWYLVHESPINTHFKQNELPGIFLRKQTTILFTASKTVQLLREMCTWCDSLFLVENDVVSNY